MHMADALISPAVGGAMWAAAAGIAAYSIRKVRNDPDEKKIPLMGVTGAFVFAAQMMNFTIPGTGSSGHLGGGMLLSIILGPHAGFLTMASILLIQALFFADGGLLALGCNVFNLGLYTCFIAYPLIYKRIVGNRHTRGRILAASMISAVVGLQLGAFSVVLQTLFSGKTELPFDVFVLLMQPIHLAIGVVEGAVTAAVVTFIWKARPEIMERTIAGKALDNIPLKGVFAGLAAAALIIGGIFSWFASTRPDGLEWSLFKVSGREELEMSGGIHERLSELQSRIALLPGYGFKGQDEAAGRNTGSGEIVQKEGAGIGEDIGIDEEGEHAGIGEETWPAVNSGTSISGLVGGALTLILAALTGLVIRLSAKKKKNSDYSAPV